MIHNWRWNSIFRCAWSSAFNLVTIWRGVSELQDVFATSEEIANGPMWICCKGIRQREGSVGVRMCDGKPLVLRNVNAEGSKRTLCATTSLQSIVRRSRKRPSHFLRVQNKLSWIKFVSIPTVRFEHLQSRAVTNLMAIAHLNQPEHASEVLVLPRRMRPTSRLRRESRAVSYSLRPSIHLLSSLLPQIRQKKRRTWRLGTQSLTPL